MHLNCIRAGVGTFNCSLLFCVQFKIYGLSQLNVFAYDLHCVGTGKASKICLHIHIFLLPSQYHSGTLRAEVPGKGIRTEC